MQGRSKVVFFKIFYSPPDNYFIKSNYLNGTFLPPILMDFGKVAKSFFVATNSIPLKDIKKGK